MTTHPNIDSGFEWGPNRNDTTNKTKPNEEKPNEEIQKRIEENPFLKSSRVARSPIKQTSTTNETKRGEENPLQMGPRVGGTPATQMAFGLARRSDETPKGQGTTTTTPLSVFQNLGKQIKILVDKMEDGKRRSINQSMRDIIDKIKALYELSAIEMRDDRAKEVIRKNNASQTSPWLKVGQDAKRKPESTAEIPCSKRQQKSTPSEENRALRVSNEKPDKVEIVSKDQQPENKDGETWSKIVSKSQKQKNKGKEKLPKTEEKKKAENAGRKTRSKPRRPDAIVIAKTGETSYANMLKKMRANPDLKELGENVNKIRKTAKGELLIELKRGRDGQTAKYKEDMSKILQTEARIKTLCQHATVELRDLDEATTQKEICVAIEQQLPTAGSITEDAIKSMRVTRDGTQTALITLTADAANKLLAVGRIKIGWVRCRVREHITPTRCFKCLEYGHIARHCKNEADRAGTCLRCGSKGHVAKKCTAEPKCAICDANCKGGNNHATGSYRCAAYKNAMRELVKKQ